MSLTSQNGTALWWVETKVDSQYVSLTQPRPFSTKTLFAKVGLACETSPSSVHQI